MPGCKCFTIQRNNHLTLSLSCFICLSLKKKINTNMHNLQKKKKRICSQTILPSRLILCLCSWNYLWENVNKLDSEQGLRSNTLQLDCEWNLLLDRSECTLLQRNQSVCVQRSGDISGWHCCKIPEDQRSVQNSFLAAHSRTHLCTWTLVFESNHLLSSLKQYIFSVDEWIYSNINDTRVF